MKLINYFEDISSLGLINPSQAIKNSIFSLSPKIDDLMQKTDYLEGRDVLIQKINYWSNFFGKFYYQKLFNKINKHPKKFEIINDFKKFEEVLIINKRKLDDYLSNFKSNDTETKKQNIDNVREITFYFWVLFSFIKKNEKMLISSIEKEEDKEIFNKTISQIWDFFEREIIAKNLFEKKGNMFFPKTKGLFKPFSNSRFYKQIRKENKDFKEIQKKNQGVETFYLQYIGSSDEYDYRYKCIKATGTFDTEFETIFDAYFVEVDADKYTFFETPISYDQKLLKGFRQNQEKIQQLKQIYNISKPNEIKLLNEPIKKIKITNPITINIKLYDNEKIKLDPLMVPFGELNFE